MKARVAFVLFALASVGCTTVTPLRPLTGGTARQAWQDLSRTSRADGTLGSYASVRVKTPEGRRSFRATLQLDDEGRVRMNAFTPVGTGVFDFEVVEDRMRFAEHSSKTSWNGLFSEIAGQLGIPYDLTARAFARLAFGLPATDDDADLTDVGDGVVRQGSMTYTISGLGLTEARRTGTTWVVRYEPGSFPPEKVTFEDESGRSIIVRHLDLSHSNEQIAPLVVDESYTCCVKPVLSSR